MSMYVNENGAIKDTYKMDLGGGYVINGIDFLGQYDFTESSDYGKQVEITTPININSYSSFLIRVYSKNSVNAGWPFPTQGLNWNMFTFTLEELLMYKDTTSSMNIYHDSRIMYYVYGTTTANPNTFKITNMVQRPCWGFRIFGIR